MDHLHVRHDGLFEGRAVAVPAALLHRDGRATATCATASRSSSTCRCSTSAAPARCTARWCAAAAFTWSTASARRKFWDQVRHGNCVTTSGLIGVMAAFLAKSEPRADDGDNPLRCMTMFPINEETVGLARAIRLRLPDRFQHDRGVGATGHRREHARSTAPAAGRAAASQCRLVDEHDVEVAARRHRRADRAQRHCLDA